MYLVGIIDGYSRYLVRWALTDSLAMPFVLDATQRALALATPTIFHRDQGSHFTRPQFLTLLSEAPTQISMDGRGRALDNIFIERFWHSINLSLAPFFTKWLNHAGFRSRSRKCSH